MKSGQRLSGSSGRAGRWRASYDKGTLGRKGRLLIRAGDAYAGFVLEGKGRGIVEVAPSRQKGTMVGLSSLNVPRGSNTD